MALEVVRVVDLAADAQELRLLDGLLALEALQAVLAALALAQVTLAAQRPARASHRIHNIPHPHSPSHTGVVFSSSCNYVQY